MKIVTKSNNINTLKLLVSSNLAKQQMEVEYVSPAKDSKGILPVLKVDGAKFVMPGPAAIFLLQEGGLLKDDDLHSLEALLEWERISLYPVMVTLLQHKQGGNKAIMNQLKILLEVMETNMAKQEYLGGGSLSVVDVLVWSDVYPVMTDSRLKKEFSMMSKTFSWFERLAKHSF